MFPTKNPTALTAACLLGLAALLTACSTTELEISPVTPAVSEDTPYVMAEEKSQLVSVELITPHFSRKLEELPTFGVFVENRSEDSFIVAVSSVRLYSGDKKVRAYSTEEYLTLVHEKSMREAEAYSGQQAETILQGNATMSDPAIHDNSAMMAKITSAKAANKAAGQRNTVNHIQDEIDNLIDIHQINPGKSMYGIIKYHAEDIQANLPLRLVVAIGDEEYAFDFAVTE